MIADYIRSAEAVMRNKTLVYHPEDTPNHVWEDVVEAKPWSMSALDIDQEQLAYLILIVGYSKED